MLKAAIIMTIAFAAFIGATLAWGGGTLDGRSDPCAQVEGACDTEPSPTTTVSPSTTTAPTATTVAG